MNNQNRFGLKSMLAAKENGEDVNKVIAGYLESENAQHIFYDKDLQRFFTLQGIDVLGYGHDRLTLRDGDYVVSFEGEHAPNPNNENFFEFQINFNSTLKVINLNESILTPGSFTSSEVLVVLDQVKEYMASEIATEGYIQVLHRAENGTPFESHKSESDYAITNEEGINKLFDSVYHGDLHFVVTIENEKLSIKSSGCSGSFHCEDYVEFTYKTSTVAA